MWIIYILFFFLTLIPWAFLKYLKHLNVKIHCYISNIEVYKLKNSKSLPFYFLVHSNPCLHRPLSSPLLSNNLYNKVFKGTNGSWICGAHEERIWWCILLRPLRHLVHNTQSSGVLSFCSPTRSFFFKVHWVTIGLCKLYDINKTNLNIYFDFLCKHSGIIQRSILHFFPQCKWNYYFATACRVYLWAI